MWNKVSEKALPYGEEVIAFNEKWIDDEQVYDIIALAIWNRKNQ